MKTSNSGRILMTPGLTAAPFSEAMPLHPQNGDEVIAVNVGSSTYTLTGSISGGSVVLDAGETAILAYAATWYVTWRSATGAVTYPISVGHGGTGADLSGLDAGQLIAFDGSVFAGVGLAAVSTAPGDTATSTLFWSATDSGANEYNVSAGIELPNSVGVAGDWVLRTGGTGASGSGTANIRVLGGGTGSGSVVFETPFGGPITPASDRMPVPFLDDGSVTGVVGALMVGPDDFYISASGTTLNVGAIYNDQDVIGSPSLSIRTGGSLGSPGAPIDISAGNSGTTPVELLLDPTVPQWTLSTNANVGNPDSLVKGGGDAGLFVRSLSLSAAMFQTSNVAGTNANPTAVFAGNTLQTAPLTEWRGTDGTTVVASVGIGGNVDAASYSVASAPGITGTVTTASLIGKTLTFTNGLITGFA